MNESQLIDWVRFCLATNMLTLSLFLILVSRQVQSLSTPTPTHIFIGGLGYCGSRIAAALHEQYPDCIISGTVRSKERRDAILSSSSNSWLTGSVHVLDLDDNYIGLDTDGVMDLASASHIIQTVAPIADFDRDPLLALHSDTLFASSNDKNALQYVGYISSTGVYGDYGGEWVTEDSELRCSDAKSKARVLAENEWTKLERKTESLSDNSENKGPRVDCFRCGGIYGPGRGPLFSSLSSLDEALNDDSATKLSDAPTDQVPKYVNRIIVDDICGAILAAVAGDRTRCGGRAYNLVDDDPAPRKSVVAEAKRLLIASCTTSSSNAHNDRSVSKVATRNTKRRVSRATGNKRCENTRLKEDYNWTLKAPTYREGLAMLLENNELKI